MKITIYTGRDTFHAVDVEVGDIDVISRSSSRAGHVSIYLNGDEKAARSLANGFANADLALSAAQHRAAKAAE